MSETLSGHRKEALKAILRRLHAGESPEALQEEFRRAVGAITPLEIAQIEEELVQEGVPLEEIRRLCDLHLALFRESLEREEPLAPAWHPIGILMAEHRALLRIAAELKRAADSQDAEALARIRAHLGESEKHYLREENVLFPVLERHGIVEPPRVMWSEHQEIRALKKEVQTAEGPRLQALAVALGEKLASHFFKENRILFPAALRVVPEGAWPHLRAQFDEIGYCCFTPAVPPAPVPAAAPTPPIPEIRLRFPTGELTPEELEAILNTLPVDITFVDKDDTVRYFNATKDRIFVRTPAVIGRKVQNCHPEKSLPVVERILREFREGRRAVAEFWIQHKGRFVHIRYFPVRGRNGEYLGTLEVSQDITRLRELSGEKRLLDEGPTA
ncbi:MAG: DUF438 domain-containing protein [Candidatus Bipolaricaulota bacterium]|nr:DUF438 domain-containing protein [Candidatus Bipolaricaulota bacterium]